MSNRIRITTAGIHGAPTDENPTGEYPVGFEFDTEAELPAGWAGRAEIVQGGPKKGSTAITNDLPALAGKTKAELLDIAKAEGVTVEDGATNDDIKSAIELHREANA